MPSGPLAASVARYLRPEEQVVPFRERPELDELRSWCGTTESVAVRLMTGDGGAGKTRLALRLCQVLEANGWQPLWISPGQEKEVVDAARELGTPCVAVVDYAETRAHLIELLNDVARNTSGPDLRVVMLARSSGEWWKYLLSTSEDRVARLLRAEPPVTLGPLSAEGGGGVVFAEALTAFAERLKVDCPEATLALTEPEPVVLVVHAAALLAVLNHALGRPAKHPESGGEVLAELLAHEGRYWTKSAAARRLDLDVSVLRLAVMAGCLVGADSEPAAAALMACIPDLADSAVLRGKAARWLRDLYPVPDTAGSKEWIGQLRPDLIAERLVVTVLNKHPELIPRLFASLNESRAERALTVLARAALTQPTALGQIRQSLEADPGSLIAPALTAPTATNPGLVSIIGPVLTSGMIPAVRRDAIYRKLAETNQNQLPYLNAWLDHQSVILEHEGRPEEAADTIEEAIRVGRALTRAYPNWFARYPSRSLTEQLARLERLGRLEKALTAIELTVRSYREQTDGNPFERLQNLSGWLNRQSLVLERLERREDALAVIKQAVTIRRELAILDLPAALSDFAESLHNQSVILDRIERREEELAALEEDVRTYRALARADPDEFLIDIATPLNVLRRLRGPQS